MSATNDDGVCVACVNIVDGYDNASGINDKGQVFGSL